mmetsp:Transcript_88638/g.275563  ORF Transcript_88638/g.275563 Transcript_88638/m.275563 type:complete len:353 (-) Transcript_88638:145-1203(-)
MGCCQGTHGGEPYAPSAKCVPSGPYVIVDEENLSSDDVDFKTKAVRRKGLVPIEQEESAEEYWRRVTAGRPSQAALGCPPTLVIMYGTPGCGKSRALEDIVKKLGWSRTDCVHLDPDALRYYSKEYRLCLSGVHASKLPEVKEKHGSTITPAKWQSPDGQFTEDGYTVDVGGKPHFPALAMAALRSQDIVRSRMLWPHKSQEMTEDTLVDRALIKGYNVVYDTMGNEPNKFLRELLRRARSQHPYKAVVCGCFAPWAAVEARCISRATKEGRHAALPFVRKNHNLIFPRDLCERDEKDPSKEPPEKLKDGEIDTTHHYRFTEELLPGDERHLYDNSGTSIQLYLSDVIPEAS